MSYTPHNWQTGEKITAALLNEMDLALRRASSGIQAQHLGTQTLQATTQFTVYLSNVRFSTGDGFRLEENSIVCKYDGVVFVDARLYCNTGFTVGDQVILSIGRNSDVVESYCHKMQSTGGETVVSKSCMFPVSAGDLIKIKGQNITNANGTVGNTAGTYANSVTVHYLA